MKIRIVFDNGEKRTITYTGNLTFPEWFKQFSSFGYFILEDNSDAGNMVIDIQKISFIELI